MERMKSEMKVLYLLFSSYMLQPFQVQEVGASMRDLAHVLLYRGMDARARLEAASKPSDTSTARPLFVDVLYKNLIADPIAQLRQVYSAAGMGLTSEADEASTSNNFGDSGAYGNVALENSSDGAGLVARWRLRLQAMPQHRDGHHKHSLSSFGWEVSELRRQFEKYSHRFNVPVETK
jgi:hypothetical protein